MHMKLIMYSSTSLSKLGTTGMPDDMSSLVKSSKLRNVKHGITGALYYSHGRYLQIIEGESKAVDRLMVNILKDNRHEDCLIQIDRRIEQRIFPVWRCQLVMVVDNDPYLRKFIKQYSKVLKAMPSESRIAFNHFFKKRHLKRAENIAGISCTLASLDIFGNKALSLSELPNLASPNLAPLMVDLCNSLKQRPHSVDQLIGEFGEGKRYELLAFLKDLNSRGLIEFND